MPQKPSHKEPEAPASELRKHYYLERYVVIAPRRNLRPDAFKGDRSPHKTEGAKSPAIEKDRAIFQIKDEAGDWLVKVISNAFPALSLNNPKAYGKQEIVIETPKHNTEFSELPIAQIQRIFDAYSERIESLIKLKDIKHVSVFKNDGPKAGASIAHAHSQIIAWPLIPPDVLSEAVVVDEYIEVNQSCPHCDVISWEQEQKVRVIYEDKHVIALSPYATRVPFGAWIMPKKHRNSFSTTTADERQSFAVILKKMTALLDQNMISYNFFLQNHLAYNNHHFVLRLDPRVSVWAGGEFSTGIYINIVSPEYAALWYQGKADKQ
ncbi:MAG TPA: DUF4931 domain-containing protein [Patescibacteria group bacterium]|nr:DUF4931 domain-containing protein [Patescibacteria group bacterium]HSX48093.1 DUF4931 domain-containing protein [Candidatus Nanoarchaeia archaeon]